MSRWSDCYWPLAQIGDALDLLARRSGLTSAATPDSALLQQSWRQLILGSRGRVQTGVWVDALTAELGLEAEEIEMPYLEVEELLSKLGPALLQLPGEGEPKFILVLGKKRRKLRLLRPDASLALIKPEELARLLCWQLDSEMQKILEPFFDLVGDNIAGNQQARQAILRDQLQTEKISNCWIIRLPPGASFLKQASRVGLFQRAFMLFGAYLAQYGMMILSWWVIGTATFSGRFDAGWLLLWILLLLSQIPLSVWTEWTQSLLAVQLGMIFKPRLLQGCLHMEADEIRHMGAGQMLGRTIETQAVENLGLSAGFNGVVALVELLFSVVILSFGTGGWLRVFCLLLWTGLCLWLGWKSYQKRKIWTESRINVTNDLVERMVGHRTRLVQESRERWHDQEDQLLEQYYSCSKDKDIADVRFGVLLVRGWMFLGLLTLLPLVLSENAEVSQIAVAVGGILVAMRAFQSLNATISSLIGAVVAWQQVAPLFRSAAREGGLSSNPTAVSVALQQQEHQSNQPLVDLLGIDFRYRPQSENILSRCNLTISDKDRIVLEGPSGGGKSTMASILAGLRETQAGSMMLNGVDIKTLGRSSWQKRVVLAPQFHENHVLSNSFAFNLLMGRSWPATREDMEEAMALCEELGLGPLIRRMPAGLLQMVGQSGWRLSHGEKSRLFIARALLQKAELVILDESFAALDPKSLQQAIECVLRHAKGLLVVAHP